MTCMSSPARLPFGAQQHARRLHTGLGSWERFAAKPAPSSWPFMARAVPRARCAGPLGAEAPAITRSRIASASGIIPLLIWFTAMLTAADGSVSAATCASAPGADFRARPGAASGARASAGAGFRAADLGLGLLAVPLAEGATGACTQQLVPPLD